MSNLAVLLLVLEQQLKLTRRIEKAAPLEIREFYSGMAKGLEQAIEIATALRKREQNHEIHRNGN